MRIPLTKPKLRRRLFAGLAAAAAVMLVTAALAPEAHAGGPDGTLCHMDPSRVSIPANFTVNACFDGSVLTLSNKTSVALLAYAAGDVLHAQRNADSPDIAAALTTWITDDDIIPPGSYLQLWLGPGTTDIQMEVALDANSKYDLYELLLGYLPSWPGMVTTGYDAVANAVESISDAFALRKQCEVGANWLTDINCSVAMAASIERISAGLLASLGLAVAKNLGLLTAGLINTAYYLFIGSQEQQADLDAIANSTPTLHIAAAAGTAAQSGGSGSSGGSGGSSSSSGGGGSSGSGSASASVAASNSNGQLMVQLANFPLGTTHYFCHSGSGYPTGGAIASEGSVSVTAPDESLGALCSGSGNFWIGFQAADGNDYYSNQVTLTPPTPPAYQAGVEVTVASQASGGVSGHTGPGNSYAAGPTHPANAPLGIVCYVNGQSITGPYDTTTIWDLANNGYYYTDAWLYTGTNGPAVGACPG
jgi:uncharacterized membrane protein YgcG